MVEWVQDQMTLLKLEAEFQKVESSQPEGTVLTQSIDANEEVAQGTTVTFTYSDGTKLIAYPITFDVPYSPEEVLVQMFLDGEEVFNSTVPGDYATTTGPLLHTLYAPAGEHRLQIYAADQLWRDEILTFSE